MSTPESTYRPSPFAVLLSNVMTIAALVLFAGIVYLGWPLVVAQLTGTQPAAPALAPATVATPRPLPAQVQPAPLPAAPVVQPTAYTLEDANRAADEAYRQAIQQAELNAAPLPNESKVVESAGEVNADWCRGSHLSRPECQPGNGSKGEK